MISKKQYLLLESIDKIGDINQRRECLLRIQTLLGENKSKRSLSIQDF